MLTHLRFGNYVYVTCYSACCINRDYVVSNNAFLNTRAQPLGWALADVGVIGQVALYIPRMPCAVVYISQKEGIMSSCHTVERMDDAIMCCNWNVGVVWQGAVNIPKDATYDEYLELTFPEDQVSEQMLDPLSLSGPSPFSSSSSHKAPTEVRNGKSARSRAHEREREGDTHR